MTEQEVGYRVAKDGETPKFYLAEDVEKLLAAKDKEIEDLKAKIHSLDCSLSSAGKLLEHQTGILKKLRVMEE